MYITIGVKILFIYRNSETLEALLETGSFNVITLKGRAPSLSYKDELVNKLVTALQNRFSYDQSVAGVIEATRLLNFKSWPMSDSEDISG